MDFGLYHNPADPTSLNQDTATELENHYGFVPGSLGGEKPVNPSFRPHPSLPITIEVPEDLINTPKGNCIKACIKKANKKQKEFKEACTIGGGPTATLAGHLGINKSLIDCINSCK